MKKALLIILTVIVLSISVLSLSVSAGDKNSDCFYVDYDNYGYYYRGQSATPIKSYLVECDNGNLMRVQYVSYSSGTPMLFAEYYDSNFNFISRTFIDEELPIFGGFYSTDKYYFILSGQENLNEDENVEVFRLTKYDKSWNRLASVGLSDCNTIVPFRAASARFADIGDVLYVRSGHQIYKLPDGLNHQKNITIKYDIEKMTVLSSTYYVGDTSYGYASHSFNQFVMIHNNNFIAVDHSDAYPRSVVFFEYNDPINTNNIGRTNEYDLLKIPGEIGDNYTGCQVGGLEVSSSAYIVAGSVIDYDDFENSNTKNIFLSVLPHSSKVPQLKMLTNYPEGTSSASSPHLVKITDDRFLVLWERDNKVSYVLVDRNGDKISQEYTFEGHISDCAPIIYNGKVLWYTYEYEYLRFYEIGVDDVSDISCTKLYFNHTYETESCNGDIVTVRCTKCNETVSGDIGEYSLSWNRNGSWYFEPGTLHPGTEMEFDVNTYDGTFDGYNVSVSDTAIGEVYVNPENPNKYIFKAKDVGKVNVIVSLKYDSRLKMSYTVNIKHTFKQIESHEATCTNDGYAVQGCINCDYTYNVVLHSYGHWKVEREVVEPTCTTDGYRVYGCERCDYTDITVLRALDHGNIIREAVEPTCTTDGYRIYGCHRCDYTYKTIIRHSGHNYQITDEEIADCTSDGYAVYSCMKCGDTYKTDIKATKHCYESEDYEEATCTTNGYKIYSCIDCGDTYKTVYPATGHCYFAEDEEEATCTNDGYIYYECVDCGDSYEKALKAEGHDYKTKVTREPTYAQPGEKKKTCRKCGSVKRQAIARIKLPEVTGLMVKKIKVAESSEITLSWTAIGEGVKYEVYQKSGDKWKKLKTTDKTSYRVKRLKAGKEYKFRVRAVVDGANGGYSKTVTAETIPGTTSLKLKSGKKQLTASWSKVSDVSGYEVQYSTSKKFSKKTTKKTTVKSSAKSAKIKKLKKGKKYYVRVRTYKTVNGKKVYSVYSSAKSCRVK